MFPRFRFITIAKTDVFKRVGTCSGYTKIIRGHVRKCLTRLPARGTLREMATKTLQLKRAQLAYRSECRKFFKAFVLGARTKARFHTLPVSLPKSSSELWFGGLPPSKLSSTRSDF